MNCDSEKLTLFLDRMLDLDSQLELLDHLDDCEACFENLYRMCRDRDTGLVHYQPAAGR